MTDNHQKIVAHFSWAKSTLRASVSVAIFGSLMWIVIGDAQDGSKHGLLWFAGSTLVIVLGLWLVCLVLFQLVFKDARGVWTNNGNLYFLDYYGNLNFSRLPTSSIEKVDIGSNRFWRPTGIVLALKQGGSCYLPTMILREKKEAILHSLEQIVRR